MTARGQPAGEAQPDPVVVELEDALEIDRPDHDPHGESQKRAAHSTAACDECGTSGLVPTIVLEEAYPPGDRPERGLRCADCAE